MELMQALAPTDVNSDMIGTCEEVYYTTADLKGVSYLDDCEAEMEVSARFVNILNRYYA